MNPFEESDFEFHYDAWRRHRARVSDEIRDMRMDNDTAVEEMHAEERAAVLRRLWLKDLVDEEAAIESHWDVERNKQERGWG